MDAYLCESTEAWSQTAENCGFSAVAVHSGCRHLFRGAEAVPHGPDFSADLRGSPVVVRFQVVDAPDVQVVLAVPVVVNDRCAKLTVCRTPAVAVHQVRRQFPVVVQKLIPMVLVTMGIPQLQYSLW